jgi:hypothetical protein
LREAASGERVWFLPLAARCVPLARQTTKFSGKYLGDCDK